MTKTGLKYLLNFLANQFYSKYRHEANDPVWLDATRSRKSILVLETAYPPSFYIPWADVNRGLLQPRRDSSFGQW